MHSSVVFSGSSDVQFTKQICDYLNVKAGEVTLNRFSNGETR